VQFGTDALTTAVFEIIISGTLGCLMVRWLSPLLLKLVRLVHASGQGAVCFQPWVACKACSC
jgi:hypothetical protein